MDPSLSASAAANKPGPMNLPGPKPPRLPNDCPPPEPPGPGPPSGGGPSPGGPKPGGGGNNSGILSTNCSWFILPVLSASNLSNHVSASAVNSSFVNFSSEFLLAFVIICGPID